MLIGIIFLIIVSLHPQVVSSALPSSYRNATTLINDAINFESQYPSLISHSQIGATVKGTPIYVFKIGNPDGGKVLIDASIHGNENAGSEVVWWFMNWLLTSQDQDAVNIRQRNYVMVVPILNIDEFQIGRENAHDVDLNRNYKVGWKTYNDTTGGSAPLSEPETQAIYDFVFGLHLSSSSKTWYLNVHTNDQNVRVSPPWGYLSFTPEKSYYEAVYSNYSRICNSMGSVPFPYVEQNSYGGGLARDQMYALGAYSLSVEVSDALLPLDYSTVSSTILNRFKSLVIAICRESEVKSESTNGTIIPKDWMEFVLNHKIEISISTVLVVMLVILVASKLRKSRN